MRVCTVHSMAPHCPVPACTGGRAPHFPGPACTGGRAPHFPGPACTGGRAQVHTLHSLTGCYICLHPPAAVPSTGVMPDCAEPDSHLSPNSSSGYDLPTPLPTEPHLQCIHDNSTYSEDFSRQTIKEVGVVLQPFLVACRALCYLL